ncbi:MAG: DUF3606 domain-containing protein [Betaproteobacteria bacterium RIFCSPLOWO2_12_FULL_62_13b]|nr:MAG: DUF3606 domain-containing protein [Betaproteobacteria bacterium RIFCSPLOWO2_12_FULL_62_13b]
MADDTKQRHGQDRKRIDVDQDYELRYWTKELGVTEQELKQAVRAAGTQIETVRRYLDKH